MINKLNYGKVNGDSEELHALKGFKVLAVGNGTKVMNTSNAEMHNLMLIHYGEPEIIEGKPVYMTVPDTEDAEKKVMQATEYHLMPTSQVRQGLDGIMYRTYKLLRGSSTYDPSEMARLIDGLITSCKEAGLAASEIATPDEKRILKERYGVDIG